MRHPLAVLLALLFLLATRADAARREAKLLEGSVDACALLKTDQVTHALAAAGVTTSKGVLTQTWGSACRWSATSGDAFLSVVAHTKHGPQTFNGLKRHLAQVRNRPDLAPQAYQAESKIYLLKRGAFVTVEWKSARDQKIIDDLVRSILKQLDELAAAQATHR